MSFKASRCGAQWPFAPTGTWSAAPTGCSLIHIICRLEEIYGITVGFSPSGLLKNLPEVFKLLHNTSIHQNNLLFIFHQQWTNSLVQNKIFWQLKNKLWWCLVWIFRVPRGSFLMAFSGFPLALTSGHRCYTKKFSWLSTFMRPVGYSFVIVTLFTSVVL